MHFNFSELVGAIEILGGRCIGVRWFEASPYQEESTAKTYDDDQYPDDDIDYSG